MAQGKAHTNPYKHRDDMIIIWVGELDLPDLIPALCLRASVFIPIGAGYAVYLSVLRPLSNLSCGLAPARFNIVAAKFLC